ncbi:MAG: iron-containing alcohol dehydrogenase [Gammaproteobacteria bacterium]|nr:MAG: iron-containing alcohol dehydrogenase [Gammaproteobacteria bacterium]
MPLPDFFEFHLPTRVLYGAGLIDQLSDSLPHWQGKRALLITDQVLEDLGLAERARKGLARAGIRVAGTFNDVPPDSTITTVESCAAAGRRCKAQVIVALGGGSVMDTAKVANILMVKGGRATDHMGAYILGNTRLNPMLAIPTTAGTGSEVTKVAVIADPDSQMKLPFAETQFFPEVALLDPTLTTTLPPLHTALTGMDALTHAIESYVSREAQPASDALALYVIETVNHWLVRACQQPDDLQARGQMLVASCLAGMAFTQSMVGIVHGIAHALGGRWHIPHGLANALVLPEGMAFNLDAAPARFARIAEALGLGLEYPADTAARWLRLTPLRALAQPVARFRPAERWLQLRLGEAAIARVRQLNQELAAVTGMPLNLRDSGMARADETELAALTEAALADGSMLYNPREVTADAVRRILKRLHQASLQPITPALTGGLDAMKDTGPSLTGVFESSEALYDVLGEFYTRLIEDPDLGPTLAASRLCVQFVYEDPDAIVTLDGHQSPPTLTMGPAPDAKPDVIMTMKADFAHAFWLGKANLIRALSRRQVRSKGNVPKAVKLLPVLKPAFRLYPAYLKERGLTQLLAG